MTIPPQIARLASYWLEQCDKPGWCGGSDTNKDGIVNFDDYVLVDE